MVMVRLYNFPPMGPIVHFYMQISDRFLSSPTTTETVIMSHACTAVSFGQNLTTSKSIYGLKNQAMAIMLNKMEGLFKIQFSVWDEFIWMDFFLIKHSYYYWSWAYQVPNTQYLKCRAAGAFLLAMTQNVFHFFTGGYSWSKLWHQFFQKSSMTPLEVLFEMSTTWEATLHFFSPSVNKREDLQSIKPFCLTVS